MVFTEKVKAAIKFLPVNKHYGAKRLSRLWKEFRIKTWSLRGLNKLVKKIDETGFIQRLNGVGQLRSVRYNDSIELSQQLTLGQEKAYHSTA